uniref:Venom redulysin-related 3 n=1 Tax=Platymeris rhadamanthus TaxID=1134088 RepID=A0A6B9L3P6_PLARH|nr:venom redulysin-related 3 [Platymeris rhadamanthus]
MSKIWLLLVLVAAFQFVQSYPAEYDPDDGYNSDEINDDYLNDEQEKTWTTLKIAVNKLLSRYRKLSKEDFRKILKILYEKLCNKQEDFEEEEYESDEAESIRDKIIQTIKELIKKIKKQAGEKKEKLMQAAVESRAKVCALLSKGLQLA